MLQEILSFLTGKRFAADAFRLTMGTAIAQAITMVILPILTRLYTPDQFGVFSLFSVIAATFSTFVCLSYEPSIVLPKENGQAARLLLAISIIAFFMSGLGLVIILLFNQKIIQTLRAPGLLCVLWWLPLILFTSGIFRALTYWFSRFRNFGVQSAAKVVQTGVCSIIQLVTGVARWGDGGLTFGYVLGQLAATLILIRVAAKDFIPFLKNENRDLRGTVSLLYQYRKFPLYASWGDVMNSASFHIVPLLLSTFFGMGVVGLYSLGYRLITFPMSLIGASIAQVLLQRVSEQLSKGNNISSLTEAVIGKSILLWTPFWLFLALFAPQLFSFVFGSKWAIAGSYVRVLAPLFFLQLVVGPVSAILTALQKLHIVSLIQTLLLIGACGSIGITALFSKNSLVCIGIYSVVQSVLYLIYLLVIIYYSSASPLFILQEAIFYNQLKQKR